MKNKLNLVWSYLSFNAILYSIVILLLYFNLSLWRDDNEDKYISGGENI